METYEHCGNYSIRKIGKDEVGIHMPSEANGKFSIYKNEDATVFLLRKELPFKTEKFLRDCNVAAKEPCVDWKDAKKELGIV